MKLSIIRNSIAWLCIIICTGLYAFIAWAQYANMRNGIDLGTYTQILYNLSSFHSFPPYNSILGTVAWGDHAHFVMILLAPLFALYPHDITVIALQMLAVTTSAWALFDIAHRRFKNFFFSYAMLFSYLFFFGIQYALSFDVHANVFTAAALAWLFWTYETKKYPLYWIMFGITLTTREDAALFTGAFGFYAAVSNVILNWIQDPRRLPLHDPSPPPSPRTGEGKRQTLFLGALTLAISIAYFFIVNYAIMPPLQPNHTALAYFDADTGILLHPVKILQNMLDSSVKVRTIKNLFGSFGLLPLASPLTYLAAAPNLLARFLSGEQQRWDMKMHYSASLASILSYGSILGTAMILRLVNFTISRFRRFPLLTKEGLGEVSRDAAPPLTPPSKGGGATNAPLRSQLIITSLFATLLLYGTYSVSLQDTDLPIRQLITNTNMSVNPYAQDMRNRLRELEQTIPQSDSVATISSFVPVLATREKIYNFESITNASTDWIILSNQFTAWPLSRADINTAIHNMKQNLEYQQIEDANGLFVFRKK